MGAFVVDGCGGEPLLGTVIGGLGGAVFALAVSCEISDGWLNPIPPHEDESAESI